MPSNTPVTATVSEPSKPEPFVTFYAIQTRGARSLPYWTQDFDHAEKVCEETPGSRIVTVPGECDDAPSGWRDAKEPPEGRHDVLVLTQGGIEIGFHDVVWKSRLSYEPIPVTHWHELPAPPPGAKK